jgi:quercetin dioxygenase-like cupin family protein
MRHSAHYAKYFFAVVGIAACASQPRSAPPQHESRGMLDEATGVPGACDTPSARRTSEIGCYLTAVEALNAAPKDPLFWYLHTYPDRIAAENARPVRGTIVESQGKVWLFTMAEANWHPSSGNFVARVGPIPVTPGKSYTVRYMEATFIPGMHTNPHRHSGAEAWFVLSGAQCLETPDGITVVRAGETALVREGPPMLLSGVGTDVRRALILVVHDSSKPWITPARDWNAKGLCPK